MRHTFKDFLPLIIIFIVIIVLTCGTYQFTEMSGFMYGMQLFMGFFFLIFGLFKMIRWNGFVMAYKKYDVLAKRSNIYAHTYPLIEIGLAIAYLTAWNIFYTNIVTLVLMLISAYGVWLKLREKEEIPCACLGTVFKLPMTKVTLFEDLLMAGMALIMLVM